MTLEEATQNIKKWLACINRDDLDCLRVCDSCQNHVEAVTFYESLTVIVADAEKKTDEYKQLIKWLAELAERRKQPKIIHCGECVYYDPPHVENKGVRYEYSEMPKEAFDVLGTGLVSVEYGINIGGRCCVDYYCKNYPDDKRVYVPKDNYCGRAERRTDG